MHHLEREGLGKRRSGSTGRLTRWGVGELLESTSNGWLAGVCFACWGGLPRRIPIFAIKTREMMLYVRVDGGVEGIPWEKNSC